MMRSLRYYGVAPWNEVQYLVGAQCFETLLCVLNTWEISYANIVTIATEILY
jgi:hypothetical protein